MQNFIETIKTLFPPAISHQDCLPLNRIREMPQVRDQWPEPLLQVSEPHQVAEVGAERVPPPDAESAQEPADGAAVHGPQKSNKSNYSLRTRKSKTTTRSNRVRFSGSSPKR